MKFESKIIEIVDESHDTKTFILEKPDNFSFVPGQHCMVFIPNSNNKRPFTISSSPTDEQLSFTIKKIGDFTSSIFQLKSEDIFRFEGPYDSGVTFKESDSNDIVYIAAGSGITPFISAIRYMKAKGIEKNLTVIFGNKTESDILFKKELENNPKVTLINILSREKWDGETGHITIDLVKKYVKSYENISFYVCGPFEFSEKIKNDLEELSPPAVIIK
jgi:hypothetical protein